LEVAVENGYVAARAQNVAEVAKTSGGSWTGNSAGMYDNMHGWTVIASQDRVSRKSNAPCASNHNGYLMAKKRTKPKASRGIAPQKKSVVTGDQAIHLLSDIRSLIEQSREQVARIVNAGLVWLYWNIGRRIREDILHETRADYGEQIVQTLSGQLTAEFGKGFGRRSLFRMMQFAEFFPDENIVSALSTQLGWSHFVEILSINDPLKTTTRKLYVTARNRQHENKSTVDKPQ
jgi:hypothetical protein